MHYIINLMRYAIKRTWLNWCSNYYHAVFKKENIGFGEPKEDICDTCAVYKNLQEDETTDSFSTAQENHIAKVQEARQAYKEDHS